MRAKLNLLKREERPRLIRAIAEARAHGDLKENAEYHAAKEQQGLVEARTEQEVARFACRPVEELVIKRVNVAPS